MPDYTLMLNIEPDDLANIQAAGQKITLAKPVNSDNPSVIWLTIDPFQSNTVEWEEDYWVYASTTKVVEGSRISKMSEVTPGPSVTRGIYAFQNDATFGSYQKKASVAMGTFAAANKMDYKKQPILTFGLSQTAMVNSVPNERKPISAQSVLSMQQITMTPFTHVYVWLQGSFSSETIITKVSGQKAVAKFGETVNTIKMHYDADLGVFVQGL